MISLAFVASSNWILFQVLNQDALEYTQPIAESCCRFTKNPLVQILHNRTSFCKFCQNVASHFKGVIASNPAKERKTKKDAKYGQTKYKKKRNKRNSGFRLLKFYAQRYILYLYLSLSLQRFGPRPIKKRERGMNQVLPHLLLPIIMNDSPTLALSMQINCVKIYS